MARSGRLRFRSFTNESNENLGITSAPSPSANLATTAHQRQSMVLAASFVFVFCFLEGNVSRRTSTSGSATAFASSNSVILLGRGGRGQRWGGWRRRAPPTPGLNNVVYTLTPHQQMLTTEPEAAKTAGHAAGVGSSSRIWCCSCARWGRRVCFEGKASTHSQAPWISQEPDAPGHDEHDESRRRCSIPAAGDGVADIAVLLAGRQHPLLPPRGRGAAHAAGKPHVVMSIYFVQHTAAIVRCAWQDSRPLLHLQ